MNRQEAKEILLLFRPGTADAQDPEMAQALTLAQQDPELGQWFQEHQAFQTAMQTRFRQIEVPATGKLALLSALQTESHQERKIVRPPFWRLPVWQWAAAAVVMLGLTLLLFWPGSRRPDHFADYQQMMVSKALRGYTMDWATSDMTQLRRQLAEAKAPAGYRLPPGVAGLQLTGGARLTWRTHPVSLVCFKRRDQRDVWLFVMKRSDVRDPPPVTPRLQRVDRLMTASWSQGDVTYVLAGPPEPGFPKEYF